MGDLRDGQRLHLLHGQEKQSSRPPKRARPCDDPDDVIESEESSSSDVEMEKVSAISKLSPIASSFEIPGRQLSSEEILLQKAKIYQLYMKQIPVPSSRGSLVPCSSWTELGKSLKLLYRQPLHYLTNVLLKQWDQERIGTEDENQPLDAIVHPVKAEATIWLVEEVHRTTSSHHHLGQLWLRDPLYPAFIDSVVPDVYNKKSSTQ